MGDTRLVVDSTWEELVYFLFIVKFLPCEEYLPFSIINFDVMINDIEQLCFMVKIMIDDLLEILSVRKDE